MSFQGDVDIFAEAFATATEKVVRGTFIEAGSRITRRTPVDTGRAKGNWFAAIDEYSGEATEATDKSGSLGPARAQAKAKEFRVGQRLTFVNNLTYIIRLEDGYSSQAPAGMVKVVFTELETALKQRAQRIT